MENTKECPLVRLRTIAFPPLTGVSLAMDPLLPCFLSFVHVWSGQTPAQCFSLWISLSVLDFLLPSLCDKAAYSLVLFFNLLLSILARLWF